MVFSHFPVTKKQRYNVDFFLCVLNYEMLSQTLSPQISSFEKAVLKEFFFLTHVPRVRSLKTEHRAGAAKIIPSNVSGKQLISDLG